MNLAYRRTPTWELEAKAKALKMLPALNTPEQDADLKDIKVELALRRLTTPKVKKDRRS